MRPFDHRQRRPVREPAQATGEGCRYTKPPPGSAADQPIFAQAGSGCSLPGCTARGGRGAYVAYGLLPRSGSTGRGGSYPAVAGLGHRRLRPCVRPQVAGSGRTQEQMLLSAVRAAMVAEGEGVAVGWWVGSGVVPTRLGTFTTYGLPAPRVTWMMLPALSSFTRVAPGNAAATVRASWKNWLE